MARKLKIFKEHNSMNSTFHLGLMGQKPTPNGIACPKCGEELLDTKPNEILTSNPAQKNVGCSSDDCNYTSYIIA